MMDWENGNPNARFWILKLLKDSFGPGDKLAKTDVNNNSLGIVAQGFLTKNGKKLLLINKRNIEVPLQLPAEVKDAWISYVDETTQENPPFKVQLVGDNLTLKPFSVMVLKLKD